MRISTKLFIVAIVPAVMAVAMGFGLFMSSRAVEDWQPQQQLAAQISADTSELSELARAYTSTHEERPQRQFAVKVAEARDGVERAMRSAEEHRADLEDLAYDLELSASLFERLVANFQRGGADEGDPLFVEAERRLSGQLFIRLQSASNTSARYVQDISTDIVDYQQSFSVFATALTVLTALTITAGLIGLISSITRSLAVLRAGTERIGAGDLDYRIGLTTHDEIGELGRSFDRMSTRLKTLIVTKTQLEHEVEARMKAQAEARAEARVSSVLAQVSATLASSHAIDEALESTLAISCDVLGAVGAVLADRVDGGWRTRRIVGVPIEEIGVFHSDEESPARASVFQSKEPHLVSDVLVHAGANPAMAERAGYRSYVAYPLLYRDQVVGAVSFFFEDPRQSMTDSESFFLGRLAYIISVSTQNARLFRAEQAARREADHELETTSLLLQAANELAHWADPRGLMQRLADVLHQATGHARTAVLLWHESTAQLELAAFSGTHPLGPPGTMFEYDDLTAGTRALLSEHSAGFVDFEEASQEEREASPTQHSRLMYLAPISLGDRFFGFVSIDDPGERRDFAYRETEIIRAIAAQAAVALENARLYEAERTIAERLQSAMLAMPESVAGLEFGYEYRSASESARVGGDFYDLFEIDDRLVGITIGDIAGKGLNAAVLTSLVKNAVRAHGMEKGSTPARILALTNEVVYRGTGVESFATVFFAVLDRVSGRLDYCNAGHTSTVIARANGTQRLGPTGPILGAFPDVEFGQGHVDSLGSEDTIFLFTDGLVEARSAGELFGDDRLVEAVTAHRHEPPTELVCSVVDEALEFSGGQLSDDVAIMALRRV